MTTDIFISHSTEDREIAETICSYFTERGLSCVTSSGAGGSGEKGSHIEALSTMRVFILIYSRSGAASGRVSRQLDLAENKENTFVLPYRIDDTPLSGRFAKYLTNVRWLYAYPANNDLRLDHLFKAASWVISRNVPYKPGNTAPETLPQYGSYCCASVNPGKPKNPRAAKAAAVIAIFLMTGAVLGTVGKIIKYRLDPDAKSKTVTPARQIETEKKEVRPRSSFSCKVFYNGAEYSGEYTGEIGENGLPCGSGSFTGISSDDNASCSLEYSGEFTDGAITGKGTAQFAYDDGRNYEFSGYFENGVIHGRGKGEFHPAENENIFKETYEGLWYGFSNVSEYKETEYYTDGHTRIYTGELKNDFWTGDSTLEFYYTSGDIKEEFRRGTWTKGELEGEIYSKIVYTSGNYFEYTGGYSNDAWNGEGIKTIYFSSGEIKERIFQGSWTDDILLGDIIWTEKYNNGDVCVIKAPRDENALNGKGTQTYTYASGKIKESVFEGSWKNGKKNGEGVLTKYYRDSDSKHATLTVVYEGLWTDDSLSGDIVSTETFKDGTVKVYKGGYSDGNWNGKGELTYTYPEDNEEKVSKVTRGSWTEGELKGKVSKTEIFKNGDVVEYKGEYSDSKRSGKGSTVCTNEKTGEKWTEEGEYEKDNLINGTKIYYGKDGGISKTETYMNGKVTGTT